MIVYKKYSNFDSKPLLCIACSFTEVIPVVFAAKSHGPGTVNMSEIAYFALSEVLIPGDSRPPIPVILGHLS